MECVSSRSRVRRGDDKVVVDRERGLRPDVDPVDELDPSPCAPLRGWEVVVVVGIVEEEVVGFD